MRPRTYRVDGHEIKFTVENDIVHTVIDGKEWTDTNIRAAAVSIGDTVGDWIVKSIMKEAETEGWNPIWGLKKEVLK